MHPDYLLKQLNSIKEIEKYHKYGIKYTILRVFE